jgi:hypothetical protein
MLRLSFWRGRRDDSSAAPAATSTGPRRGRDPSLPPGRLRPEAAYALTLGAEFALVAYLIVPLQSGAMLLTTRRRTPCAIGSTA